MKKVLFLLTVVATVAFMAGTFFKPTSPRADVAVVANVESLSAFRTTTAVEEEKESRKFDCGTLPASPNGPKYPDGCPGAVNHKYKPNRDYCIDAAKKTRTPWHAACCTWLKGTCIAKPKKLYTIITSLRTTVKNLKEDLKKEEQDVANDVLSCPNDGTCFYMVDREDPPAGYRVLTIDELGSLKADFVSQYNNIGLPPAPQAFQSGNCCVATKSGHKLTISGTPYGYQFPAGKGDRSRCSPSGGYTESYYRFYGVPSLTMASSFSSSSAADCATNHNPAVAIRNPLLCSRE